MVTAQETVLGVLDPELPLVTIGELGIVRSVDVDGSGAVAVVITPTYTGCPAMGAITDAINAALRSGGWGTVSIETVLSPAWTTDWITESGREKLRAAGIAPPTCIAASAGGLAVAIDAPVACPRCGSRRTRRRSEFGATACKATYVCRACAEPFEAFKPL